MTEEQLQKRLKETQFVVEATSCEIQMLWERWSDESLYQNPSDYRLRFDHLNPGYMATIGHINRLPVVMTLFWHSINGVLVMFWEATSRVVDYDMCRAWLNKNCAPTWDNGTRLAHTNATNFHNVVSFIREGRFAAPDRGPRVDMQAAADLCGDKGYTVAQRILMQSLGSLDSPPAPLTPEQLKQLNQEFYDALADPEKSGEAMRAINDYTRASIRGPERPA